jgi:acid phosphatase
LRRQDVTILGVAGALLALLLLVVPSLRAHGTTPLALCGNPGPAPGIQHVVVVMLENESHEQVVGDTTDAPYINSTLTKQCGYASNMFGVTHYSAANYLALTAGQYPIESPAGCGSVAACDTAADNLFHQAETHGLSWKAYEESMPAPCTRSNSGTYSLGHNPVPYYDDITDCATYDVPVEDLTSPQGAFWDDLQNKTLPSFSFVTPDDVDNGHDDGTGVPAIDDFLSQFVPLVQSSPAYQDGTTAVLVTFDEGSGGVKGQDCTNQSLDMAGNQESCHIPFFVVYPYTKAGAVTGFFNHYSVTRTVEELFHLPLLAGAVTAPSLAGPFGLVAAPAATPTPTPTLTLTAAPTPTASPTNTPSPPTEYVENTGFEAGTEDGWSGIYTTNSLTYVTQDQAQTGTWCLAISSSVTDARSTVGVTSKPPVIDSAVAGTPLTGSVFVKASTPGIFVTQLVWETLPDGSSVGYQGRSISLQDTNWHRIKAPTPYVVKNDGDHIWFSLYTKGLPAGAVVYADNVSLTSPAT